MPFRTTINGKEKTITLGQAVILSVAKGAVAGKVSQQKLFIEMWSNALGENLKRNPLYDFLGKDTRELGKVGLDDEYAVEHFLRCWAEKSEKT